MGFKVMFPGVHFTVLLFDFSILSADFYPKFLTIKHTLRAHNRVNVVYYNFIMHSTR